MDRVAYTAHLFPNAGRNAEPVHRTPGHLRSESDAGQEEWGTVRVVSLSTLLFNCGPVPIFMKIADALFALVKTGTELIF